MASSNALEILADTPDGSPRRREYAWPWLAFLIPAILVCARPIDDVDIFWQVRIGQHILDHGFDVAEPLSYIRPEEPMRWIGWLGQVAFGATHRTLGWPGVQALHVLAYAGAWYFVYRRLTRNPDKNTTRVPVGLALFSTLLMLAASLSNCSERPQSFAFLAFALLLWLVDQPRSNRAYWFIVVPLMVVWQNIHPSLPVVAAVLMVDGVGRWLDGRRSPASGAWNRSLGTAIVAAGMTVCTPAGLSIFEISRQNAATSQALGIGEWLPAYATWPASAMFWCVLGIMVLVYANRRPRPPWRLILVCAFLTLAAVTWTRMIVFWAMASAPLLADLLKTLRISPARTNHLVTARRSYVLAVVCGGLLALASPWVRPELSFLPESRRSLLDPQLPIAGVARLKQVLGAGRIYNYREWAGVLALEGSAHWRVRIDGRIYRYPLDEWHQYNQVAGAAVDHRTILMADHPAALFLRPDHDRALIQSLQTNPEWIDLYEDPQCHIFISRLNALVAAAHEESAERLHETSHPAPW